MADAAALAELKDNLSISFDGLQALEVAHRAQIDFEREAHAAALRAAEEAQEAATEALRVRAFAAMASLRELRGDLETERALRVEAQSEVTALRGEIEAGGAARGPRTPRSPAHADSGAVQKALTLARRQLALQRSARLRAEAEAAELRTRLADAEAKLLRWETEVATLRRRLGPEADRIRAQEKAKYEAALKEAKLPKQLLIAMDRKMDFLLSEYEHDRQERHEAEAAARERAQRGGGGSSGGGGGGGGDGSLLSLELQHLSRRVDVHEEQIEGMSEGIRDVHETTDRALIDLHEAQGRADRAAADAVALGDEDAEMARDRELGLDALIVDLADSVRSAGEVKMQAPHGSPRQRMTFSATPKARRGSPVRHVRVGSPQQLMRTSPARLRTPQRTLTPTKTKT